MLAKYEVYISYGSKVMTKVKVFFHIHKLDAPKFYLGKHNKPHTLIQYHKLYLKSACIVTKKHKLLCAFKNNI